MDIRFIDALAAALRGAVAAEAIARRLAPDCFEAGPAQSQVMEFRDWLLEQIARL